MAKRERIFAGFGAALFLVTSSALAIAVIISLTSSSSTPNAPTTPSSSTKSSTSSKSSKSSTDAVGTKLQGFTPLTKPVAKLEIANLRTGTGAVVKSGATVSASYVGALAKTGVIFGSTESTGPQTFSLNSVIEGWQLGIPGMKVGGTRELIIPAGLAYGSKGNSSIPPNADLVFLVTIDSVKNPK